MSINTLPVSQSYKEITSLEERKKRSELLLIKYSDKIPVILEKSSTDKYLPKIDKNKLLISQQMNVANIIQLLKTSRETGK